MDEQREQEQHRTSEDVPVWDGKYRDIDVPVDSSLRIVIESLTQQVQHSLDFSEEMRKYLLLQVESVRDGTAKQLESMRILLSREYVTEVRLGERIEVVRSEISTVRDSVDKTEKNIVEQIEKVSKAQEERQRSGYMRVIAVQSAILLAVLSGIAAVIVQILLHH